MRQVFAYDENPLLARLALCPRRFGQNSNKTKCRDLTPYGLRSYANRSISLQFDPIQPARPPRKTFSHVENKPKCDRSSTGLLGRFGHRIGRAAVWSFLIRIGGKLPSECDRGRSSQIRDPILPVRRLVSHRYVGFETRRPVRLPWTFCAYRNFCRRRNGWRASATYRQANAPSCGHSFRFR